MVKILAARCTDTDLRQVSGAEKTCTRTNIILWNHLKARFTQNTLDRTVSERSSVFGRAVNILRPPPASFILCMAPGSSSSVYNLKFKKLDGIKHTFKIYLCKLAQPEGLVGSL